MSTKKRFVLFTTDKNGKPLAYRRSLQSGIRYFRISYDEAKMLVATGQAIEDHRDHRAVVAPCEMEAP